MKKKTKSIPLPLESPRISGYTYIRDLEDAQGKAVRGGAASVYLYRQDSIGLDRVVKVLDPKTDSNHDEFAKTFEGEVKVLGSVTHRNIIKIIDADTTELNGVMRPYYVMEYLHNVGGEIINVGKFFEQATSNDKDYYLNILIQILDGLSYLHVQKDPILHCDLKPDNILCHEASSGDTEIRIADLGVAKRIPSDESVLTSTDTTLFGTHIYMPDFSKELNKSRVTYEWLRDHCPVHDLCCLGWTIADLVSSVSLPGIFGSGRKLDRLLDSIRPSIALAFTVEELDALKQIIEKLTSEEPGENYDSAVEARNDFAKLTRGYLTPMEIDEVSFARTGRAVNLSVGRIQLTDRVSRVVDHPSFRRLEYQNQLNFVYRVFPDGKHSRWAHSLHAYATSLRYLAALVGDAYFRVLFGKVDCEAFIAAALLHDIGHYPLAHAIEDICDKRQQVYSKGTQMPVRHRYMTSHFIERSYGPEGSLRDRLQAWSSGFDVDRVIQAISFDGVVDADDRTRHQDALIRSMISGPIDLDKIAYLVHDSASTGVPYGAGIDVEAFLDALAVKPPKHKSDKPTLGIHSRGIAAVDGIVAARYHMYERVYWHHTNRAHMSMIKFMCERVFSTAAWSFSDYIDETEFLTDVEAARLISTRYQDAFKDTMLPAMLFSQGRDHYRVLLEVGAQTGTGRDLKDLIRSFRREDILEVRGRIEDIVRQELVKLSIDDREFSECPLALLDIPFRRADADAHDVPVLLSNGEWVDGGSAIVAAVANSWEENAKAIRVFVPKAVRDGLEKGNRLRSTARSALELIKQHTSE